MLRFVWVWLDLVGSRESCQLGDSSSCGASPAVLRSCKLPSLLHPDPEVTHISFWEIRPMLLGKGWKNPVELGALRIPKICHSGLPTMQWARVPGLSGRGKGCGPALVLFHPYLPSLRFPSSACFGCRGHVLYSTVSRATDL